MRTLVLASAAIAALAIAGPAMAQQRGGMHGGGQHWSGQSGGQWHGGGQWQGGGGQQWHGGGSHGGHNWGGKSGGHWVGGMRAPGGWGAYRRPARGWSMPRYWISPSFYIGDWADYGLSQPPYGYNWTRYYDDAVLADRDGRVWDSVSGLNWDQYDDGYADNGDDDYDYGHDVGPGAGYPPPGARAERREYRYDNGPRVTVREGPGCGCYAGGYYYPGATTTTVTVTSVPVTTTSTYIEEEAAPVVIHRAVRKWHPAPRHHWKPRPKVRHKVRCLC